LTTGTEDIEDAEIKEAVAIKEMLLRTTTNWCQKVQEILNFGFYLDLRVTTSFGHFFYCSPPSRTTFKTVASPLNWNRNNLPKEYSRNRDFCFKNYKNFIKTTSVDIADLY